MDKAVLQAVDDRIKNLHEMERIGPGQYVKHRWSSPNAGGRLTPYSVTKAPGGYWKEKRITNREAGEILAGKANFKEYELLRQFRNAWHVLNEEVESNA